MVLILLLSLLYFIMECTVYNKSGDQFDLNPASLSLCTRLWTADFWGYKTNKASQRFTRGRETDVYKRETQNAVLIHSGMWKWGCGGKDV
jgi:hypothetical protein